MAIQEFDNLLNELQEKYPFDAVAVKEFTPKNLENFCKDLSQFIHFFISHFKEKFGSFYRSIFCEITGDKLTVPEMLVGDDCPDLWNCFSKLDPRASIRLRFILTEPRVSKWGVIYKDVFIHFDHEYFEVRYDVAGADPISSTKDYSENIYGIIDLFRNQVRMDLLISMASRDNRTN